MEADRYDVTKAIVLSGWALTLLACLAIVAVTAYSLIVYRTVDETLKGFATLCLGFLFGSIPTMVKDFMKVSGQ
jgi:hypothetical protein